MLGAPRLDGESEGARRAKGRECVNGARSGKVGCLPLARSNGSRSAYGITQPPFPFSPSMFSLFFPTIAKFAGLFRDPLVLLQLDPDSEMAAGGLGMDMGRVGM